MGACHFLGGLCDGGMVGGWGVAGAPMRHGLLTRPSEPGILLGFPVPILWYPKSARTKCISAETCFRGGNFASWPLQGQEGAPEGAPGDGALT